MADKIVKKTHFITESLYEARFLTMGFALDPNFVILNVLFPVEFPNTNYTVTLTEVFIENIGATTLNSWSIHNKLTTGFSIESNAITAERNKVFIGYVKARMTQ